MKKILWFLLFIPWILTATIYHLHIEGPIEALTEEYLQKAFHSIRNDPTATLTILQIDTPGGFDTSMRAMIKEILHSSVPVVVFVYPRGARAASAGFFLAMAADIAAMAPETNMGAAHPVSLTGETKDETMDKKITNDASSYIKALAKSRNRNMELAEKAVRDSQSYTAEECIKNNLIEYIANDLTDLVKQLNGTTLTRPDKKQVNLNLSEQPIKKIEMSQRLKFLRTITNPNFAFILLIIGLAGLYIEFTHPGVIIPGVIGGISLLLAFLAFQILPINYIGLSLILLSSGLFIAEIKVQGFGILGIGGIASFILGSLMLFHTPIPEMKPALTLIITVAMCMGGVFLFLTYKVMQSIRKKPQGGREGLIGEIATTRSEISPDQGKVFTHGEIWNAFSENPINPNEKVIIIDVVDLKLKVKKVGG